MSYWNLVLEEVLNKKKSAYQFIHRETPRVNKKASKVKVKKITVRYPLGNRYPNVNFTRREAETMVHTLRGKTITMVAKKLKLSSRTVEFYIKKMKQKLDCRTKAELIERVIDSEFLKNIDFRYK